MTKARNYRSAAAAIADIFNPERQAERRAKFAKLEQDRTASLNSAARGPVQTVGELIASAGPRDLLNLLTGKQRADLSRALGATTAKGPEASAKAAPAKASPPAAQPAAMPTDSAVAVQPARAVAKPAASVPASAAPAGAPKVDAATGWKKAAALVNWTRGTASAPKPDSYAGEGGWKKAAAAANARRGL